MLGGRWLVRSSTAAVLVFGACQLHVSGSSAWQGRAPSDQLPPSVSITSAPGEGLVGEELSFSGSASTVPGQTITELRWSFGDGGVAYGPTVTHRYTRPGQFLVGFCGTASTGGSSCTDTMVVISLTPRQSVSLPAGWNLVSGLVDLTSAHPSDPLYTWQAGDSNYEPITPGTGLRFTAGYWVYLSAPAAAVSLETGPASPITVNVPAGQYIMIGNPFATSATVSGADVSYVYDAMTGDYTLTALVTSGHGAWVYSGAGAVVTLTAASAD